MTVKEMLAGLRLRQFDRGWTMATPTVIEVPAGQVTEVLKQRGIGPDEPVTVTIEPELMPGRRESRARVTAAGLSDNDIDRLIKQAQQEVEHLLPR